MPILILMTKMIFIKYLPPVRPKLVPLLKVLRSYWNLAHFIFRISRSQFWCLKLFSLNTYHLFGPNWSQYQKCSEFIEIWHIQYFKYANLDFDIKNDFYEIFTTCYTQIGSKIKCAQNLLKFGTFDISNMSISILMWKMIFYQICANCSAQIGAKMKNAQNLLKFGWIYISNMLISI